MLLVSKHFLASDFIREHELAPILKAEEAEKLIVLWVPVGSCMYRDSDIAEYKPLHDPKRPLESITGPNRNKALVAICEQIKAAAEKP